jgi:hypothetical protein
MAEQFQERLQVKFYKVNYTSVIFLVRWVPCHRLQTHREGLQIWRVVANVLRIQSRTAEKRLSSSLGVKLITHPHKTACLLKNATEGLELARKIGMRFCTRNEYLYCRFIDSSI